MAGHVRQITGWFPGILVCFSGKKINYTDQVCCAFYMFAILLSRSHYSRVDHSWRYSYEKFNTGWSHFMIYHRSYIGYICKIILWFKIVIFRSLPTELCRNFLQTYIYNFMILDFGIFGSRKFCPFCPKHPPGDIIVQ